MKYLLWTIQALLAILFLLAGVMKLILPVAEMTKQMPMPGPFLRFIGVAEITGALGLILPGLLRIRQGLTPLAAVCLTVIMCGAVVVMLKTAGASQAAFPFCVGLLLVFVAYHRWKPAYPNR